MMNYKQLLYAVIFLFSVSMVKAQDFFTPVHESTIKASAEKRTVRSEKFLTYTLNVSSMKDYLSSVPELKDHDRKDHAPIIILPLPDGTKARFSIWKSSVMAPELAGRFPHIITLTGQGVDDRYATLKIDFTEMGFHAQVQSVVTGSLYIDPYTKNDVQNYIIYRKNDLTSTARGICGSEDKHFNVVRQNQQKTVSPGVGTQIRVFRIAVACTGEYAEAATGSASPSVAQTFSTIVTTVNRVNGIYEQESAVRLVLVPNETSIIFTDPDTDPFTGNDDGNILIDESQTTIDAIIGTAHYDIGHTFSTGGSGLAAAGVCEDGYKAMGITGSDNPVGDPYDIDYVAHEIGHQFNAPHTFNVLTEGCYGNREADHAVEPGSGVTILGYAGLCGNTNDLAANSIPVFHTRSFQTITGTVQSTTCQVTIPTANSVPVVNAGGDYTIPKSTPFKLTGSASDADQSVLTYCWEQNDTGPAGDWNTPSGNAPLFRSFIPSTVPYRYFPQITDVIGNTVSKGEILPSYGRTMEFRLTVRDHNAGCGGVANDDVMITVDENSGPFTVTAPSGPVMWTGHSTQTITWDVANTTAAPVNCAKVDIFLSTDGGLTYPISLSTSTPNDGSETVTIPDLYTTKARIMVAGEGNVFYNINPVNFTITPLLSVAETSLPENKVKIYPNPGKQVLNISLSNPHEAFDITVYDASGRLIFSKKNNRPDHHKASVFNLAHLAQGIYMLSIRSESMDQTLKWMKE
ncbi:reprolysin-like metallopeptidase [Chryseobacterium sp. RRHN12]|uniref:reprolysin-like metallopeptidase n=1 Tax=Chryseobacterium sp. RRHN12 TaxID=3437884 RepID=UPI003D9B7199